MPSVNRLKPVRKMKTNLCRTQEHQRSPSKSKVLTRTTYNQYSSAVTSHKMFFSLTKFISLTQSTFRLSAIAEDGKSHTKLVVACCAIGFKWRRNSIYRKVTAAMTPRTCMHVLGVIAAVTTADIFWRQICRRHVRGHDGVTASRLTLPRISM